MPLIKRPGLVASSESSRVYVTLAAAAFAFLEMNTRPVPVAALSVPVSFVARDRSDTSDRRSAGTKAIIAVGSAR